ncbi:MAG: choice-of-anchor Q domain-containing protein, partial [Nevskiales bacterium]
VHISGSRFIGNDATWSGGGIYLDDADAPVLIENTNFIDNDAIASDGGGILIFNPRGRGKTEIRNSSITASDAGADGGGIYGYYNFASLAIDNTTIAGNTADDGGGVYLYADDYQGSIRFRNSSIVDNTATAGGGGIYSYYATPFLQNVIVSANNAGGSGENLFELYGAFFTEFTLLHDENSASGTGVSGTNNDLPGNGTNGGNIDGTDPLLTPLRNNGGGLLTRHLRPGSPAIDRGSNGVCTVASGAATLAAVRDSLGTPRPIDGDADLVKTCDMGATEFNGRTAVCSATPATTCDTTFTAGNFLVTDNIVTNASDAFALTLNKGTSTDETLFGSPTSHDGTAAVVCVYFDNALVAQYGAAAGELSTTNTALWKQTVATGAVTNTYTNSIGNADGLTKLLAKASTTANGSSASAAAKGVRAPDYSLPVAIAMDVDVQVQTSDLYDDTDTVCATASFPSAIVTQTQTATARTIKGVLP